MTSTRLAAALPAAGALFAVLIALLGGSIAGAAIALAGAVAFGVASVREDPASGWVGVVLLAASTLTTELTPVLSLDPLLLMAVGGPLFVAVVAMVPHLDATPLVRPSPPSRRYQLRFAVLALLAAAIVAVPLLFGPVQLILTSEMQTTIAVMLVTGAGLLVFGPPAVATDETVETVQADELTDRRVRFGVLRQRLGP